MTAKKKKNITSKPVPTSKAAASAAAMSDEELSRAIQKIHMYRQRTVDLHSMWRSHLLRLCLMVTVLTLHQAYTPMKECTSELKGYVFQEGVRVRVLSPLDIMRVLVQEYSCEILNVVLALMLLWFLTPVSVAPGVAPQQRKDFRSFSHLLFRLSTCLVVALLGMYYSDERMGCVGAARHIIIGVEAEDATSTAELTQDAQFPVAALFHVIVTVSFLYMSAGLSKAEKNVFLVDSFQKQLADSVKNTEKAKNK
mmetsp:Transcript_2490/g.3760  ORF Transcript_2490/g.3760 Transcript_2490/m.3760 type:complete len:253 (-) Transcript_2490:43-801(-)|eukprot:CAMPEP_0195525324 /NCGR_PEP_ID=MMETSP0794_2-20130614/25727_1 /TAXON_ID=515487 /ORGANISM="Stephanopyxis turris, Strain CCMP 815" /LENGTH=252 /DNA_ID=CAMNT_0040655767 /DNA_START=109 /DNA_END=867 /DNA_ORIENTATION=+